MAHKVLAKDMSELVSTMRLAQQYSETTLDVEYRKYEIHSFSPFRSKLFFVYCLCRNMLSAAHVLAMDAKNLLDVVDSVRIRFPDLFMAEDIQNMATITVTPPATSNVPSDPIYG